MLFFGLLLFCTRDIDIEDPFVTWDTDLANLEASNDARVAGSVTVTVAVRLLSLDRLGFEAKIDELVLVSLIAEVASAL